MNQIDISILEAYASKGLVSKRVHDKLPIFIWNYTPKTQYERSWDEVTLLCRCLVTDATGRIVARSFEKFFNLEEHAILPNETFETYEKLDGSLILVFYYEDQLVVCSRGSFNSEHAESAKKLVNNYNVNCLDKNRSYCFELIVPWNRIVCDYGNEEKLVLLAKFDTNGNEYSIEEYKEFFPTAKKFSFSSINEIKKSILPEQEGYVIRFKSGKRIKVKGEEYVRLHKIVFGISELSILEFASKGSKEELLAMISSLPDEHHKWAKGFLAKIETIFESIKKECENNFKVFPSRKETASYFLSQKYPQVLFRMLDNRDFNDMIWKIVRTEINCELRENNRD